MADVVHDLAARVEFLTDVIVHDHVQIPLAVSYLSAACSSCRSRERGQTTIWMARGGERESNFVGCCDVEGKNECIFFFRALGSCSARARTGAVMFEIW